MLDAPSLRLVPDVRIRARLVHVPPVLVGLARGLVFLGRALVLAWVILLAPARAAAQESPDGDSRPTVARGDRVRIEAPSLGAGRREALVLAIRSDTLLLSGAFGADRGYGTALVPLGSIRTLDVARGTRSNAWKGAKIGAGVGAAFGLVVGIAAVAESQSDDCAPDQWLCPDFDLGPEIIPVGMVGFGLMGGLIGAGIGALGRSDAWEPMDPVLLRVEPRDGGAAIVASLPLRF
ncbi:MAG: hypothetical protein R6X22_00395 [Gemmatimonadota bacterium]